MRVVLQGSLEHFAPRELLAFIAANHAGTFDAESNGERIRLALRDGKVVGAEGDVDATGVMAKLLGWSDGTFSFLDDVVLPDIDAQELPALIAAAEERIAEGRRLPDLFPNDSVKFRVVNRPPGEINITAEEFQILFQIGTGKSLAQLRSESGRAAADLYPIIKRLQMTGLIEPVADADATAREAAPKPEPAPASEPPAVVEAPPAPAAQKIAEPPHMVATLTADDGTLHPLLEEEATIGRTPANSIALRDASVSAHHARVMRTPEGFLIEDVGSRNGTYINSEKLADKRLLADGDLVRLGKIILTFNLAADVKRHQSTEREMIP
ncbi:MAG TPA: FHA domain-containing protein [Thermoanaerobaculia bacterium]|jgi:pSer/pThr/pTyr-binding forkhead associated (FHA) protein|nr:FHA domain-containing protein [Thermoanaerobaculia bacterium]